MCLWWKRHVEKESKGGGWGERGKDREEREKERERRVAPLELIIILNKP